MNESIALLPVIMKDQLAKLESDQSCAIFIIAFLLFFVFKSYKGSKKSSNLPPLVNTGSIETLRRFASSDVPFELLRWAKESGAVFRLQLPSLGTVFVSGDLSLTKKILSDRESYKPQKIYGRGFISESMFSSEGFRWKHVRKSVAHAFAPNHIRRMAQVSMKKTTDFMTLKLDLIVDNKDSFDLCYEMLSLTFSIICEAAFEYDVNREEMDQFLKDVNNMFKGRKYRSLPFRNILGSFVPGFRAAQKSAQSIQDFGEKILTAFRENKVTTKGTVIECIANDKEYKSDSERINDIVVFLIAGHDTTAYSLAWTLLELAKNPHEQQTLRKELNELPIEERLKSSSLKNIIQEGMRLHPVAPLGSIRNTAKDISLQSYDSNRSIHIPKDSTVFLPFILLLRNTRYYDEPDEFRPSRWINPAPEAISAFIPFSIGKRNCIGQPLANAELQTVISLIICKYHFSVTDSGKSEFFMTMKPSGARLIASRCH